MTILFTIRCHDVTHDGLLHSDICGSILACNSPQLYAAYRVLLRLPMPRHPPCALISLTLLVWYQQTFRLPLPELCFPQRLKVIFKFFSQNCSFRNFHFYESFRKFEFTSLHYFFLLYSVFKVQLIAKIFDFSDV